MDMQYWGELRTREGAKFIHTHVRAGMRARTHPHTHTHTQMGLI
jgi:hypothetical protein